MSPVSKVNRWCFIISVVTIIKGIKAIHPEFIALIKTGTFYCAYGKDACIISNLFNYQFKELNDTISCVFPANSIKKIQAKLENSKINYLIINRRTGYTVEEKNDFKNLNTYNKQYNSSKIYINNQKRINNINEYLLKNVKNKDLGILLKEIENIINERKKI